MPVCTVQLLSLNVTIEQFHSLLVKASSAPGGRKPLVVSRVLRWIIKPRKIQTSDLTPEGNPKWDVLVIYEGDSGIPAELQSPSISRAVYTLRAGVPSSFTNNFPERNSQLLHPKKQIPIVSTLEEAGEASGDLISWISSYDPQQDKGAVTMFNFLAFNEGKEKDYLKYGQEFMTKVGKKRGGVLKIAGKATGGSGWDQIAVVHYPSIWHFTEMVGSKDYGEINRKYRLGSLNDTGLLCTSELEVPWARGLGVGDEKSTAKL